MSEQDQISLFDFSENPSQKEAHWKRDKNIRDVLTHLYEWHQLMIQWVEANQKGLNQPFLPQPYNWKTYGTMNQILWEKHQNTSLEKAFELLDTSHKKILSLIELFSNDLLFTKGMLSWTGTTSLGSYFVSNTTSHYDWALKKIKTHLKKHVIKGVI